MPIGCIICENLGNIEMQIDIPQSKPGDIYLLFHSFPYDFSHDLPLSIAPGVCVDKTPQEWLDSAEQGLADYLLPGYSLPGMGMNNCCLRCFSLTKLEEKLTFENLLFTAFLSNFDFPDPMNEWIKNEYINGRHKLAHGIHDATFGTKLRPDRYQAFGRLHEICRLSLLGFFSLDN